MQRFRQTAIVIAIVNPPDTLPLTVGSSSAAPSLKTLSVANDTCERFVMLDSYPGVAYTWREGGDAIIEVADTGIGIGPADLPHIFERFYRADKSRSRADGHAGLGLAMSRTILDAERGRIELTSVEGQGSTFTVRLTGLA